MHDNTGTRSKKERKKDERRLLPSHQRESGHSGKISTPTCGLVRLARPTVECSKEKGVDGRCGVAILGVN